MKTIRKRLLMISVIFTLVFSVCGINGLRVTAATVKPTKVTLNKTSVSGYVGNTSTIKASVKPAKASQKVTYKSSNKNVATVSSSGKITYISSGEAKITVTAGQKKATCKVKVKDRKNADIKWKYMTAKTLFKKLDEGREMIVLDIRPSSGSGEKNGYKDGHIKGALWVPAWPVDTIDKQNELRTLQVTEVLKENDAPIVIVCRTGSSGAKRAVSVLKSLEKIDGDRLYILKDGGTELIDNYSKRLEKGLKDFKGNYVISAKELKKKMDAGEKMKLVDTRGISSKRVTVKGAITMTWKQISKSTKTDGTKTGESGFARTLSAKKISKVLSELGLGKNDQIILISDGYATGGWGDDGRVLWQLQQCGYKNVKMLNGGVSAMQKACGNKWKNYSQTGPSKPKKKTVTIKSVDQNSNGITTKELLALYKEKADFKVVDVRTNAEYNGAVLYGEKSGGHLKGATHIRFTDLFRADGTLKAVNELTEMFERKGLSKDDKIITYCTGGIRSGYMAITLEMCGYENVFNYAESTYRWSNTKAAGTGKYWVK